MSNECEQQRRMIVKNEASSEGTCNLGSLTVTVRPKVSVIHANLN